MRLQTRIPLLYQNALPIFNALTGLNQHTGNWPGKTVASAQGSVKFHDREHILVDLPGTYSLMAHSTEEEVARDFICFGKPDCTIVVVDATCLERNLNLVLQTIEITNHVVVCINLMDEAKKKGIKINTVRLAKQLGVPVIPCIARENFGLDTLLKTVDEIVDEKCIPTAPPIRYGEKLERAIHTIEKTIPDDILMAKKRWLAIRILENDLNFIKKLRNELPDIPQAAADGARAALIAEGIAIEQISDRLVSAIVLHAEEIACDVITYQKNSHHALDRRLDRIFTSRKTGFPIMLLLLLMVFYLTIVGANIPSAILSDALFSLRMPIEVLLQWLHVPIALQSLLLDGVYTVVAWVVSVMLPPMAIFFPLFTLLEDAGYLPRVAFNLDHCFQKAHACGKQSLTMCMVYIILHHILHAILTLFPSNLTCFTRERMRIRRVSSGANSNFSQYWIIAA